MRKYIIIHSILPLNYLFCMTSRKKWDRNPRNTQYTCSYAKDQLKDFVTNHTTQPYVTNHGANFG